MHKNRPGKTQIIDTAAVIIPRDAHNISRANISENALKVLYRLKNAGYDAYLVGGGVRDLLLGRHPKDFDIATNALPEDVRKLFRNCRLIGRRFRLAHIHFGRDIVEVATFRAHHDKAVEEGEGVLHEGMIMRDNVYGTLESDAWRRDFTINALYYNIDDFSVVDYTRGMQDLHDGTLRMIGDADIRFQEDPVRMLRAIRFAAKLEFHILPELEASISRLAERMAAVAPARLFDEVLKLFLSGHALHTFELLRQYGLFSYLFPQTARFIDNNEPFILPFVRQALVNTDKRIEQEKPVTPAFLFATLLWVPVRTEAARLREGGMSPLQALQVASETITREQQKYITLPRRFQTPMKEIWVSQSRLEHRRGKRPLTFLEHPRFRAAYDFLLLRCDAGEVPPDLCEWWTRIQEVDDEERRSMCNALGGGTRKRRRRRRRSGGSAVNDAER
jgi:poly(A) polymerase